MNVITDGDLTKTLNVDWMHDYFGIMDKVKLSGYDTQSNHLFVNKTEKCDIKQRLIYDDGG